MSQFSFGAILIVSAVMGYLPAALQAASGDIHYVGAGGASLKSAPEKDAAVLLRLREGRRLTEYRRTGDWIRVGLMGAGWAEGWVAATELVKPERRGSLIPPAESAVDRFLPNKPERSEFLLLISGRPALRFKARCQIVDDDGHQQQHIFSGQIPRKFIFQGQAVSCRIQNWEGWGRISVRLLSEDVLIADASTAVPFNSLAVRSDGPWGRARGSRGRVKLIGVPESSAGGGLKPLQAPVLKPLAPVQ